MHELALEPLLHLDQLAVQEVGDLRWAPLTVLFVLVSAWWVKAPLLVAAGVVHDLRARCLPITGLAVGLSALVASLTCSLLKQAFDRPRPPVADPGFEAAVGVPGTASFPSGHAATAFAAATALAVLAPGLRRPALIVAAAVAVSRVYLGVHYVLDVVAGAALGAAVGIGVALLVRQGAGSRMPTGIVRTPA